MKDDVVIVSAARTPVGAFNGAFANLPAHDMTPRWLAVGFAGLIVLAGLYLAFSPSGKSERAHLARLEELVAKGQSPADVLLEGLENVPDMCAEIIRRADLGTGT